MLMEKIMPRKLRGFTLTEAAIVLGIVGLILGAIWVAAAAVYNNLRVSTTSTQLLQMVQNIRSMHATQQTMDTTLTGHAGAVTLAQAGAIPKDMLNDQQNPTQVRNVWGEQVGITSFTVNAVAGAGFTVTLPGVPQGPCTDLLVRNTGAGRDSGLLEAGANGTNSTLAQTPGANGFPITVTTALGMCNLQGTGPTANTINFTFALKT